MSFDLNRKTLHQGNRARGAHRRHRRAGGQRSGLRAGPREDHAGERLHAADHGRGRERPLRHHRLREAVARTSRRCSTSRTRSTANIISRSPRPASTGRWSGPAISRAYIGHEAKIELADLLDGRKRFRGLIAAVDDESVTITLPDAPKGTDPNHRLPLASLAEAKLVMTDALLNMARADQAEHPIDDDRRDIETVELGCRRRRR